MKTEISHINEYQTSMNITMKSEISNLNEYNNEH